MTYGSGTPNWAKGGNQYSNTTMADNKNSGLNSRYQGGYQSNAVGGSYQPPRVTGTYAEQQTGIMEDTMRTHYQAEGAAATVLTQMTTQRHQLQGANDTVQQMKQTTEQAKNELTILIAKTRAKKRKLQLIVAILSALNLILFLRLLECGGSFFCRSY